MRMPKGESLCISVIYFTQEGTEAYRMLREAKVGKGKLIQWGAGENQKNIITAVCGL